MWQAGYLIAALAFVTLGAWGESQENRSVASGAHGYSFAEGLVLEYVTSATYLPTPLRHKVEFTVLKAQSEKMELLMEFTFEPQAANSRSRAQHDILQIRRNGQILERSAPRPIQSFEGWTPNFELPVILEQDKVTTEVLCPFLRRGLRATLSKRVLANGDIVQTMTAEPPAKIQGGPPFKLERYEMTHRFAAEGPLPLESRLEFLARVERFDGENRTTRTAVLELAAESKLTKKALLAPEELAKLRADVAAGAEVFRALRELGTNGDWSTTRIYAARASYLVRFPEGRLAQELKNRTEKIISLRLREHNAESIREGKPAPNFIAKAIDGTEVDLAKLRGKVVLLEFWASWCGACHQLTPKLKKFYEKYKDRGLEIVGINADESEQELRDYLNKQGITWKQIFEPDDVTTSVRFRYGITGYPTTILIDKKGTIRWNGFRRPDTEELIEKLLRE